MSRKNSTLRRPQLPKVNGRSWQQTIYRIVDRKAE